MVLWALEQRTRYAIIASNNVWYFLLDFDFGAVIQLQIVLQFNPLKIKVFGMKKNLLI